MQCEICLEFSPRDAKHCTHCGHSLAYTGVTKRLIPSMNMFDKLLEEIQKLRKKRQASTGVTQQLWRTRIQDGALYYDGDLNVDELTDFVLQNISQISRIYLTIGQRLKLYKSAIYKEGYINRHITEQGVAQELGKIISTKEPFITTSQAHFCGIPIYDRPIGNGEYL